METPQRVSALISPAVHEAMDKTLSEHGGGLTTGFLGLVNYIDEDGVQCWCLIAADGQTITASVGMMHVLGRLVDDQLHAALFHQQEEGD